MNWRPAVERGCTRQVVLIGRWAVKFPLTGHGVRVFLQGMIHNLGEAEWWRSGGEEIRRRICPVIWRSRIGLWVVMVRARPLGREMECPVVWIWLAERFQYEAGCYCPAERKSDSWGVVDGQIVAVDYA